MFLGFFIIRPRSLNQSITGPNKQSGRLFWLNGGRSFHLATIHLGLKRIVDWTVSALKLLDALNIGGVSTFRPLLIFYFCSKVYLVQEYRPSIVLISRPNQIIAQVCMFRPRCAGKQLHREAVQSRPSCERVTRPTRQKTYGPLSLSHTTPQLVLYLFFGWAATDEYEYAVLR